jgi:iron complex transport system permease protein
MQRGTASPRVAWLLLPLAAAAIASALVGRYPSPGFTPPLAFVQDPLALRLLLGVRLPRIAAGILLGASLAGAGAVFQMIFSNPLVEPGFLGVSQGAALGAALGIVAFHAGPAGVQALALACGLAGLAGSYLVARTFRYGGWVLRLVLAGIAVSALLSAGVGVLKLAADPLGELPEITFWLLGGLWRASWRDVLSVLPAVSAGLGAMLLLRGRLDLLSLDDRVAHSLGAAPSRERLLLLFAATLAAAAAVSVSGLVGWMGLMAPHAARRLFGASSRRSLPAAMLLGAAAVLVCDALARTLFTSEIPLGIVTAVVGAGGFLGLMASGRQERGG